MRRFSESDLVHRRAPRKAPPYRYRYTRRGLRTVAALLDLAGTGARRACRWLALLRPQRSRSPFDSPVGSILLVQLDHLGDAIFSTALIPLLRHRFPEAAIDVLASSWSRDIFETNPHVRRVLVSHRNWFSRSRSRRSFAREAFALGLKLRPTRYDLGIDVRGDLLVGFALWVAGIPRRLGSGAGGGAFLLTDCPPWVPNRHELAARVSLLEPLGIHPGRDEIRPEVHPTHMHRASVARRLRGLRRDGRPLMVLHVGAGTDAKRWPLEHHRELIRQFQESGLFAGGTVAGSRVPAPHFLLHGNRRRVSRLARPPQVILVGDRNERATSRRVAAGFSWQDVVDWTGSLTVLELAALLERADFFVGADSGPAHLAAWAGTPSVVLFSGTNRIEQWRPQGETLTVLQHRTECSPCHLKQCVFAEHPCMTLLTPERVAGALNQMANRAPVSRAV